MTTETYISIAVFNFIGLFAVAYFSFRLGRGAKNKDAPVERRDRMTDDTTARIYSGGQTAQLQAAMNAAENDRNRQINLTAKLKDEFLQFIVDAIDVDSREQITYPRLDHWLREHIGHDRAKLFNDSVESIRLSRAEYRERLEECRSHMDKMKKDLPVGLLSPNAEENRQKHEVALQVVRDSLQSALVTHMSNCISCVEPVIEEALAFPERPQIP